MSVSAEIENYPGELAMLRGLVGALRVLAQHGGIDEVRRVLSEHAIDEQAAYDALGEKATASAATATPRLATRRRYLYAAIQANGSPITAAHAAALMHGSPWPTAGRNTIRKDLRGLARAGLLTADDSSGRRTYTLNTTGTST